jgi:hypothetical protein
LARKKGSALAGWTRLGIDINASLLHHHDVRTTVTLETDVAARLEQEQRRRQASFKEVVNDVLRAGLEVLDRGRPAGAAFRTTGFNLGPSLVGSLDNIEEVLSRAEGERHR